MTEQAFRPEDREYVDEFGNVWRVTPSGLVFVRTRRSGDR